MDKLDLRKMVVKNMPLGYIILRIIDGDRGMDFFIEDVNDSFAKVTNIDGNALIERRLSAVMEDVLDNSFDWSALAQSIAESSSEATSEHIIETASKKYKISVYRGAEYIIGLFDDITEYTKMESRLKELYDDLLAKNEELYIKTITDNLTGLYSREFVIQALMKMTTRVKRYGGVVTIGIVDIDKFKIVNDTYGHIAGDEVLKQVSESMQDQLRSTDYIGRYGGEEFIIVFDNSNIDNAKFVCERLRKHIESKVVEHQGNKISVTVSIGLAEFHAQSISDLLIEADKRMYQAKRQGRNQVCC